MCGFIFSPFQLVVLGPTVTLATLPIPLKRLGYTCVRLSVSVKDVDALVGQAPTFVGPEAFLV